jgi:hypothetical protein
MASFIYFYSKFTEELLLLSAAGIFTLLSIYCYTWVVKKRRLGAARNQVPAGMVKVYLEQLIGEAQFVRTQLFGLAGGVAPATDQIAAHFQAGASPQTHHTTDAPLSTGGAEIPNDLLERLKALEAQLAQKESMVVNINVEKTKLLEEVENLKQNEKIMGSASTGNNEDLIQKIKALEERLEEYALFEDDLANLKRLQQENAQLKKQLDSTASAARPAVTKVEEPAIAIHAEKSMLDQAAIDALLEGTPATPPTATPKEEPEVVAAKSDVAPNEPTAIAASFATSNSTTSVPETVIDPTPAPSKPEDQFENLVDSIETSLASAAAPTKTAPIEAQTAEAVMAAPPQASSPIAEKSDEELLKEFENLLNS